MNLLFSLSVPYSIHLVAVRSSQGPENIVTGVVDEDILTVLLGKVVNQSGFRKELISSKDVQHHLEILNITPAITAYLGFKVKMVSNETEKAGNICDSSYRSQSMELLDLRSEFGIIGKLGEHNESSWDFQ